MNVKLVFVALAVFVSRAQSQSPSQSSQERTPPHVGSIQPQQPQPHAVIVEQGSGTKSQEVAYTPYPYRATSQNPPTNSNFQNFPSTGSTYNRESYGSSRGDASGGNPIFGVSSNADFQLSAYFGQIFWGFVAVTATLVCSIWIIRFFAGTDVVGGLVEKIRDSSAAGKALDLDRITNMVYRAVDTYEKWATDKTLN